MSEERKRDPFVMAYCRYIDRRLRALGQQRRALEEEQGALEHLRSELDELADRVRLSTDAA